MSTNTVRCDKCKGQKEFAGIGGIMKPCHNCDGKGRISVPVATSAESNAVVMDIASKATNEVVRAIKRKRPSRAKSKVLAPETKDMFQDTCTIAEIFAPPIDPVMVAVLDEPRMDPFKWQMKYKDVPGLFGRDMATGGIAELITKVQRAAMRADYANAQPKIARKVDMLKSQDVGG